MLVDDPNLTSVVVACTTCGVHQSGTVHGTYVVTDPETGDQDGRRFFLVACPICQDPFLAYVDWAWVGNDKFAIDPPGTLYPDSGNYFDPSVPAEVSASFAEATKTLGAGANTATAMMCRLTLELICKNVGAQGGTLFQMLQDLKTKIDPRLHGWADEVLRELGNEAAHRGPISRDDALDAHAFTRALIQNLFVLQRSFEEFKKRRQQRKSMP